MIRFIGSYLGLIAALGFVTQAQAATYYLTPNGSDTANGSTMSPWKFISKAITAIVPGDTVILKDGTYDALATINIPNTTWREENKYQAIIDGGFSPSLFQGSWDNLFEVWNNTCAARGKFSNLLSIESDNVVVDGLFLRNSCGRGILIKDNVAGAVVQSIYLILVQWFNHSSINHLTCHHQSRDYNVTHASHYHHYRQFQGHPHLKGFT